MKQNWTYKKLGEVCEILNGFAFKSDEYKDEGIRVMRITNVQKGVIVDDDPKFFPIERKNEIAKYMLQKGDVLMSLTGNVGRVGIIDDNFLPAALNQRVACLRLIDNQLNKKFLFHILNSDVFEYNCIFNATGIAQKNMSTKWLEQYSIPLPPLETQSRIVSELDLLQAIIDKQKAQLKEYETLAQSIFYDMFGDPVDNDKGWEVKKLGEVCSVAKGLVDPNDEPYCNYPHIGGANIQSNTGEFIDVKLAKDENLISGKYLFDETMVLYSKIRPNLNKVALPTFKGVCSADMYPIIADLRYVNKYFLKFTLTHKHFIEYAISHSGRANIPKINREDLLAYELPLPPLSLQQSFAAKIESIEKQKAAISKSIAETEKLFEYTMDKYFG